MDWQRQTIGDLLEFLAKEFGNNYAVIHDGRRITFKELRKTVHSLAKGLLDLCINKGDRVGILLPNRLEWTQMELAVGLIGAVLVPINNHFQYPELEFVLEKAEVRVVAVSKGFGKSSFIDLLDQYCERNPGALTVIIGVGLNENPFKNFKSTYRNFEQIITAGTKVDLKLPEITSEDPTMLMFTSGTTSFPKGVMLRPGSYLFNGYCIGERQNIRSGDRVFLTAPLFGVFTGVFGTFAAFTHGAGIILQDSFDRIDAVRIINEEECTVVYGMPAAYYAMIKTSGGRPNESVRVVYVPAAAQNDALAIKTEFGGQVLCNAYGSTEAGIPFCTDWRDPWEKISSTGRIMEGFEATLKTQDGEKVTSPDIEGELCLKGVSVLSEYYKSPEGNKDIFDDEGYFHTGDLMAFDKDGFYWFRGRLKDMYKYKGYSVSCLEVEKFIREINGADQVAVVGIPSSRYGEIGVAFIQKDKDVSLSEQEVKEFLTDRISDYKIPSFIRFIDNIPLTAGTGKVKKKQLKEQALSEIGNQ